MSKDKLYKRINISNKKASFEFQLLTKYTAGMVLGGTEVKSIKAGNTWVFLGFKLANILLTFTSVI